jgi:hypothetical protein
MLAILARNVPQVGSNRCPMIFDRRSHLPRQLRQLFPVQLCVWQLLCQVQHGLLRRHVHASLVQFANAVALLDISFRYLHCQLRLEFSAQLCHLEHVLEVQLGIFGARMHTMFDWFAHVLRL